MHPNELHLVKRVFCNTNQLRFELTWLMITSWNLFSIRIPHKIHLWFSIQKIDSQIEIHHYVLRNLPSRDFNFKKIHSFHSFLDWSTFLWHFCTMPHELYDDMSFLSFFLAIVADSVEGIHFKWNMHTISTVSE